LPLPRRDADGHDAPGQQPAQRGACVDVAATLSKVGAGEQNLRGGQPVPGA